MVEGNTQHRYKEAITMLEEKSPGTKHQMYFGFLKRASHRFEEDGDGASVVECVRCGAPTIPGETGDPVCSFCKMKDLAARRKADPEFKARPIRKKRVR